jgi:hypothetical protein
MLDREASRVPLITFDPSTRKRTQMGTIDEGPPARAAGGFDVSLDGHTIVFTRVDSFESDIMLVENFH